jgi:ribosomal protein S18 acetylase RimI-like enzyme
MQFSIQIYSASENQFDIGIEELLQSVYVVGGFTAQEIAQKLFTAAEVKKRGTILLATDWVKTVIGMIIVGADENPFKQVATKGEAEMQLLATDPAARGQGVGEALCRRFETESLETGLQKAVLSTQPAMEAAHKLYTKLGYERNPTRDWERGGRVFWVFEKKLTPPPIPLPADAERG